MGLLLLASIEIPWTRPIRSPPSISIWSNYMYVCVSIYMKYKHFPISSPMGEPSQRNPNWNPTPTLPVEFESGDLNFPRAQSLNWLNWSFPTQLSWSPSWSPARPSMSGIRRSPRQGRERLSPLWQPPACGASSSLRGSAQLHEVQCIGTSGSSDFQKNVPHFHVDSPSQLGRGLRPNSSKQK